MILCPYLVMAWCENTQIGDNARAERIFEIVDRCENFDDTMPLLREMLDWHPTIGEEGWQKTMEQMRGVNQREILNNWLNQKR